MSKIDEKRNKRQLLRERLKRHKKPDNYAKLLCLWLSEAESNVDLAHVLQSLQDNRKDYNQLAVCREIIVKFTNKARITNRGFDWLKAIDQLLQDYQDFGEVVPSDLYISKYYCLVCSSTFHPEAEKCLSKAITLSRSLIEKIEAYLVLAQYYVNISEYSKIKKLTIECEAICNKVPDSDLYLARTYYLRGLYYFYNFRFHKSRYYLNQAQVKFESLLRNQKHHQQLITQLSSCFHYIGRTYFEQYNFFNAANLYIQSQELIEEEWKQNSLTPNLGKTAYYHLRLGEILEACKIEGSATYHFEKARNVYTGMSSLGGVAHVNLALAKLIGNPSFQLDESAEETFKKREKQIKDSAAQASKVGYVRLELMAFIQLLSLYVENLKFALAIDLVLTILSSKEFYNLGYIFLISFTYKIGFKLYYKIKFDFNRTFRKNKILYSCPCSDPKCKLRNKDRQEIAMVEKG